jgi:transposase
VVVVDFERLEALFNHLNLGRIRKVLMSAYHRVGLGRPPFNPLGLLRFKIVHVLKGYRSQRALEREVRVDSRVRSLCGFDERIPSYSTIVRFERRIGFERLKKLVEHTVEDLVKYGLIKGLKVVLDFKPLEARCRRDPKNPSRRWFDRDARLETAEMVRAEVVVCDKQYSSRKIRKFIVDQGAETVIPYSKSEERRQRHLKGRIEVQGSRP